MTELQQWFTSFSETPTYNILNQKPLAYFCAEFALEDSLPTYAGGLGILAGDYIRELADQQIPAVAVSLCYKNKYPEKKLNEKPSTKSEITPQEAELEEVMDAQNQPLRIKVPIQDEDIIVKVWKWQKQTIPVYLLDTDCPENPPEDRLITHKLYDANKEIRLKQELILGIGGYRVLEALGIQPSIFHMNEGHSALLALEIIRHEMQKRKVGFQEAIKLSLHHVIFTNHTLIQAGNEIFSSDLFTYSLTRYASQLEIPVADILALGLIHESSSFSMSLFALRLSGKSNAVSLLHAQNAEKIWPDYKIEAVTNGIHLPTWDKIANTSLRGGTTKQSPTEAHNSQLSTSHEPQATSSFGIAAPHEGNGEARNDVETAHQKNKTALLSYIKQQTGKTWQANHLLIGWARRMVRYKRPLALFAEIEWLKKLTNNPQKPIRIIISGSAHPADDEGVQLFNTLQEIIKNHFSDTVVYLPDYKKNLALQLTSGVDLWLNTPVVGSEACGTSGMKACLNGVLPASTRDGWIDEVDLSDIGWILDNDTIHESLLQTLEQEIIPRYYDNPNEWNSRMTQARTLIQEKFSTTRMLKEYLEKMYIPIITAAETHYFS